MTAVLLWAICCLLFFRYMMRRCNRAAEQGYLEQQKRLGIR